MLDLPPMQTRQKVEQVKAYFSVLQKSEWNMIYNEVRAHVEINAGRPCDVIVHAEFQNERRLLRFPVYLQ